MQTVQVVEAFNVSKDAAHGGLAGWITVMKDLLELELSEEALHRCIVVTVAGAAHAGD